MKGLSRQEPGFTRAVPMNERTLARSPSARTPGFSSPRNAIFPVLLGLGALIFSSTSLAAACKETKSVVTSAESIEANKKAGGHVEKHIKGKPTEASKTQFVDETSYKRAWDNWVGYTRDKPTPKTCGTGGTPMDCVPAVHLNIHSAYKCTAVGSDGKCTEGSEFVPESIAFRYLKENGKWILNTAYPANHDNCD
jgi:hypothetical protein